MTRTAARRVVDVTRIQLVNSGNLVLPGLVFFFIGFGTYWVSDLIYGNVGRPQGQINTVLLLTYLGVGMTHAQTITRLFPFALGISVTRRAFYAGTTLVVVGQALSFGLFLMLMKGIEQITGGWGLQLVVIGIPSMQQGNFLAEWFVYSVPFLVLSALFILMGVVHKRWGPSGMFGFAIGVTALIIAAAGLIAWQQWWPAVGSFFADQSSFALIAGYPLVIAVLLLGAGYVAIRRATP